MARPKIDTEYTAADDESVERIKSWLEERKLTTEKTQRVSQAALARMARIGVSTFSQVLSGTYVTSPTKMLEQVLSAIKHVDQQDEDILPPVETSVFKLVQTACTMARRNRNFSVFSAYVGTGKTFALKYYAKHNPNTFLIEADPTMTPQTIVKELAKAVIGPDVSGTNYVIFQAIVNELSNTDSLLIIDEAETLTPKQLEIIRRLRDKSNVGVVLSGTEYLNGLIKPEHGQFDQIRSRSGFWPETIRKITRDDSAALIQAGFPGEDVTDEVIDRLVQYSAGSARMLVEGLIANLHQFRKGLELNTKLVDAVASQALCLQAVK
ncbi:MAG: AAA family ATPase [Methylophilus sp.]